MLKTALKLEFKSIDENGKFSGYASTFGNLDRVGDIVERGAFAKSLAVYGAKVPILWNHNSNSLIGFNISGEEDDYGLKVDGQLNINTSLGSDVYQLAKQSIEIGAALGLSIGYSIEDSSRDNNGIRTLKSIILREFSFTPFPANTLATVTTVKSVIASDDAKIIATKKRDIEEILIDAGCSVRSAKSAVSAIFQCDAGDEVALKKAEELEDVKNALEQILSKIK